MTAPTYTLRRGAHRTPVRTPRRQREAAPCDAQDLSSRRGAVDPLVAARATRILALQELALAIRRAELRFDQTAEIGERFDRRLADTKVRLLG